MSDLPLSARITVRRSTSFTLEADVEVPAPSTLALLGPNGAGKSTVVDALAGVLAIDAGHIRIGTRTLDDPDTGIFVPPHDRHLGIVFQRYHLFEHLDALDNVAFGPRSRGASRRESRSVARRWLERLHLDEFASRRPGELSGGQAQRIALARALASEPRALVLDEPLAALDVETRVETRRMLAQHLGDFPGPRILITHDPTDAFVLADRIAVIEDGRVVQSGSPESIRRHPSTPYVASLTGVNLLRGRANRGVVTLEDTDQVLHVADTELIGEVHVTIAPSAIALYARRPEGSPRNVWASEVVALERLGHLVRVTTGQPLPLAVDITPAAVSALGLGPGTAVWVSVKATELGVRSR